MASNYATWNSTSDYASQGHGSYATSYGGTRQYSGMDTRQLTDWAHAPSLTDQLTPIALPEPSVADQVFGGQFRRHQHSLEHLAGLIKERTRLHENHRQSLWMRHYHIQARLFGARLHGKLDGYKQATRLEQMVMQLDEQLRNEEIGFWKDSMDIQEKMIEVMQEYEALKHRASLVEDGGLEGGEHA